MSDQAVQLLQGLADRLGTTTEYLWRVLLSQARLAGAVDVLQDAIVLTAVYLLVKWIRSDGAKKSFDDNPMPMIAAIIGAIIGGIGVIICIAGLQETAAALFNPEYWALNKILTTVKK